MSKQGNDMVTTPEQQATYEAIIALGDIGDKMLDAVERENLENVELISGLVFPVVESIKVAIEEVADAYADHVEADERSDVRRSMRVDRGIKKIYDALYQMKDQGEALLEGK